MVAFYWRRKDAVSGAGGSTAMLAELTGEWGIRNRRPQNSTQPVNEGLNIQSLDVKMWSCAFDWNNIFTYDY